MNESKNTQQNEGDHAVCPELRTTDLIPQVDTVSMKAQKAESKSLLNQGAGGQSCPISTLGHLFCPGQGRGQARPKIT
jgi:hypothetical protein